MGELKTLMTVLLMHATIEIDPSSSQRPSYDYNRSGFGIMPPKGDMRVIIKKRKVA